VVAGRASNVRYWKATYREHKLIELGGKKERKQKKESDKAREKFTNTLFKIEVGELERNKGTKKRNINIYN